MEVEVEEGLVEVEVEAEEEAMVVLTGALVGVEREPVSAAA